MKKMMTDEAWKELSKLVPTGQFVPLLKQDASETEFIIIMNFFGSLIFSLYF